MLTELLCVTIVTFEEFRLVKRERKLGKGTGQVN
jgi:hypothetical protein